MIAFISYSIRASEVPVITILSEYLKDRFVVETLNVDELSGDLARQSPFFGASLYIGIFTAHGKNKDAVKKLFSLASERNIPSMLFEEVPSDHESSISHENIVRYNRAKSTLLLEQIQKKIEEVYENLSPQNDATFIDSKELAWLISGNTASNVVNWLSKVK